MGTVEASSGMQSRTIPEGLQPDFTQLIQALWLQAMISCGKVLNPMTRKYETDHRMAQYHIGLLEVIEAKTEGNLEEAERRVLTDLLDQARMAFVDSVGRRAAEAPKPAETAVKAPEAEAPEAEHETQP